MVDWPCCLAVLDGMGGWVGGCRSMGLRQCTSCSSFLHPPSARDWPHLTCQACHTSFCGHCSMAPHLPLPCSFARAYGEWCGFLERMTLSARDLALDPASCHDSSRPLSPHAQAIEAHNRCGLSPTHCRPACLPARVAQAGRKRPVPPLLRPHVTWPACMPACLPAVLPAML